VVVVQEAPTTTIPQNADLTTHRIGTGFLVLAALTFCLLIFGATVRIHGAGLSCPDWPLCFGEVIPQLDFRIFLEWGHRVFAGSVSTGFLVLGALVAMNAERRALAGRWLAAAVVVLLIQIVLGGLTVLQALAYWTVTSHLLAGNLFLFLLVGTGLRLRAPSATHEPLPNTHRYTALALGGVVLLQMALGGLVSSNQAGLACTHWPSCNGSLWFPSWSGIIGLQLMHRMGAYTVLLLTGSLLALAWPYPTMKRRMALLLGLVISQISLGVINIFYALPVETAILHAAIGDATLLMALLNALLSYKAPPMESA